MSEEFQETGESRLVETDFGRLAEKALSRRRFLSGSAAFAASAFVMSTGLPRPLAALAAAGRFGFEAVAANGLDTVTVPRGYGWHVVARWGDPLWSRGTEFDQQTRGTGASQELAFGDNNDGMALFSHRGRNVLAVNNEYVNLGIIFGGKGSGKPANADDVRKGKAGHGVSVLEIARKAGQWSIVKDSPYNRRITPDTPMEITGPARGHDAAQDRGRSRRRPQPRHLEQLRQRPHPLGHLPRVRGEFPGLLLVQRPGPEGGRRIQALRRGCQGLR